MQTVTQSDFRSNMKSYFDKLENDRDVFIIPRNGKDSVVFMTLSDYNSLKETEYLLSNPANKKHLEDSIKELDNGSTVRLES